MAYIREYSPGGGCMGFPSIKYSYAYKWWLGLLRVVQALKVIILPLPLSAGVMCCPPLIFKPSLGRREIYRPVSPSSQLYLINIACSRRGSLPDVLFDFTYPHNSYLFSGIPQINVAADKNTINNPVLL